jgi:hypothetical protein
MVKSAHVRELEDSIEMLNNMDKAALDNLHKEQMQSGELSVKGGAGLGLIDIIRKTGEKYAYQFLRLDENSHFFILKTTVHFSSSN